MFFTIMQAFKKIVWNDNNKWRAVLDIQLKTLHSSTYHYINQYNVTVCKISEKNVSISNTTFIICLS